jgi:hypothetical protein
MFQRHFTKKVTKILVHIEIAQENCNVLTFNFNSNIFTKAAPSLASFG